MYPRVSPEKGPRVPGGACDGDVPVSLPPQGPRCAQAPPARPGDNRGEPGRAVPGDRGPTRGRAALGEQWTRRGLGGGRGRTRSHGRPPRPGLAPPCALRRETELQTRGVPGRGRRVPPGAPGPLPRSASFPAVPGGRGLARLLCLPADLPPESSSRCRERRRGQ